MKKYRENDHYIMVLKNHKNQHLTTYFDRIFKNYTELSFNIN